MTIRKQVPASMVGSIEFDKGWDFEVIIPFITLQSPIENFNDNGTPANTWATLELESDFIAISAVGNDSMTFSYSS